MKRIQLIAVALCTLLLTTVGVGVVAARQEAKPPQANDVAQFDVDLYGVIVGKIIINTKEQTFVFNGAGLTAGRDYFLTGPGFREIASAKADDDGAVHMRGLSFLWSDELADNPQFWLSMVPAAGGYGDVIFTKLTACYEEKPGVAYWNVYGYLTNAMTGAPLPNERVDIWQYTSNGWVLRSSETTDSQGYFYYSRYFSTLGGHAPQVWHEDSEDIFGTRILETYTVAGKCA